MKKPLLILALIFLVLHSSSAWAETNVIADITDQFGTNMASWTAPLQQYAAHIFWLLVLIDFTWTAGRLAIGKSELNEYLEEFLKQGVVIGLYWAFLTHAADWGKLLVQSFQLAGHTAGGLAGGIQDLQPSDIFMNGVNICTTILKTMHLTFNVNEWVTGLALLFAGFIVLVSFCLISALEIVVIVEAFVSIYTGVFYLAFSGHRLTADVAMTHLRNLLGIGAKLMVIQLVVGLGMKLINQWTDLIMASQGNLNLQLIIQIAGGAIAMQTLCKQVPLIAQATFGGGGGSTSGASLVSSAMAAGSIATGVSMAAASGVAFALGQPETARRFAQGASDQAGEAFRHTTDHHGINPTDRFFQNNQNQQTAANENEYEQGGSFAYRDSDYKDPNSDRELVNSISGTGKQAGE